MILIGAYLGRESALDEERARGSRVRAIALDPRDAARREVLVEICRNAADDSETVVARAERESRLVMLDAIRKRAVNRYIGRICRDDIEFFIREWSE